MASEYALLAAGVVIIAGGATIAFRSNLLAAFAEIGTQIVTVTDRLAGRTPTSGQPATATSSAARGPRSGGDDDRRRGRRGRDEDDDEDGRDGRRRHWHD